MEEKQKETVEKIGSIKERLAQTDTEQLMEFVQVYESDSRAGVQKLVETARKRFDKLQQEKIRTENLKKYEKEYDNYTYICGIDEVGRGPLAGPVVAAAVILPKDCDILYINDSKKLSAAKREELYDVIMEKAVSVGIGMVGPERIDEINILQATFLAMQRAIDKLGLLSGGGSASAEHGAPTQTPPVYQERFLVHMGARMKSVTTAEIAYFMADGKYLHLVTHDGKDYIVDRTLTEVGEKLPPNLFFRINRRFIVAFDAIREMIRYSGSRIKVVLHPPLAEGEEAFVSTDRVPDFRQWLNR